MMLRLELLPSVTDCKCNIVETSSIGNQCRAPSEGGGTIPESLLIIAWIEVGEWHPRRTFQFAESFFLSAVSLKELDEKVFVSEVVSCPGPPSEAIHSSIEKILSRLGLGKGQVRPPVITALLQTLFADFLGGFEMTVPDKHGEECLIMHNAARVSGDAPLQLPNASDGQEFPINGKGWGGLFYSEYGFVDAISYNRPTR